MAKTKQKGGNHTGAKMEQFFAFASPTDLEALDSLVVALGFPSRSELMRNMIKRYIKSHAKQLAAAGQQDAAVTA